MSAIRPRKIFLTGASGFIGRVVLERLSTSGFECVVCLARRPEVLEPMANERVALIKGDLNDPSSYRDALARTDVVVHLAAATGAASESELRRVNVEGTRCLLDACRAQKVEKILHVSSIAAGYPDLTDYPYGCTKLEAEELVRRSGMNHVVLRPTIVLGVGGPTWTMLRKLASLPLVPVFGGGSVDVQPICVQDVASGIAILLEDFPADQTIELGGPEVLTFRDLLRRIRTACGRSAAAFVPVPVAPVRMVLRILDGLLPGRLPVSPAQLVPFVHDGKAKPNFLHERLRASMTSLDALLLRVANAA
jgi:NADH dehydrogenase